MLIIIETSFASPLETGQHLADSAGHLILIHGK
jgi:hypothetical protein